MAAGGAQAEVVAGVEVVVSGVAEVVCEPGGSQALRLARGSIQDTPSDCGSTDQIKTLKFQVWTSGPA